MCATVKEDLVRSPVLEQRKEQMLKRHKLVFVLYGLVKAKLSVSSNSRVNILVYLTILQRL